MAQDWLRRTGISRPISFAIRSHASLRNFTSFILPVILPASNRWQHLCLDLSADKTHCLSPIKGALSSLKSLRAKLLPPDKPKCDIFEIAPKLFHVHIECEWSSGGFALPWTQLTDVSFNSNMSLDDCLTIISDCPNLVSCTLNTVTRCGIAASSRFRNSVLHHAHLRKLKLEAYVDPSAFFDCLSIPELCTFHIIHAVGSFYASAANFLLRSSCTTVIFTWDSFNLCPIEFGLIIQFMPELEEL